MKLSGDHTDNRIDANMKHILPIIGNQRAPVIQRLSNSIYICMCAIETAFFSNGFLIEINYSFYH